MANYDGPTFWRVTYAFKRPLGGDIAGRIDLDAPSAHVPLTRDDWDELERLAGVAQAEILGCPTSDIRDFTMLGATLMRGSAAPGN